MLGGSVTQAACLLKQYRMWGVSPETPKRQVRMPGRKAPLTPASSCICTFFPCSTTFGGLSLPLFIFLTIIYSQGGEATSDACQCHRWGTLAALSHECMIRAPPFPGFGDSGLGHRAWTSHRLGHSGRQAWKCMQALPTLLAVMIGPLNKRLSGLGCTESLKTVERTTKMACMVHLYRSL